MTVAAANTATGFMLCSAAELSMKSAVKVTSEIMIIVLTAIVLWLTFCSLACCNG